MCFFRFAGDFVWPWVPLSAAQPRPAQWCRHARRRPGVPPSSAQYRHARRRGACSPPQISSAQASPMSSYPPPAVAAAQPRPAQPSVVMPAAGRGCRAAQPSPAHMTPEHRPQTVNFLRWLRVITIVAITQPETVAENAFTMQTYNANTQNCLGQPASQGANRITYYHALRIACGLLTQTD